MWEIEYNEEVKFYFLDNYPYTFELLVEIEKLRHIPDAVPPEGCVQVEPNLYEWEVLDHLVYYRKFQGTLVIATIKPL